MPPRRKAKGKMMAWRLWGILILPYQLAAWSTWQCRWGHDFAGRIEPLSWRLGVAWAMWLNRYWYVEDADRA